MPTPARWFEDGARMRALLDSIEKPRRLHPTERVCCGGWKDCQRCIRYCECLKDD